MTAACKPVLLLLLAAGVVQILAMAAIRHARGSAMAYAPQSPAAAQYVASARRLASPSQLLRLHESGQWCCPDNYLHIHFCRATLPDTPAWHRMPISIVELPHEIVGREAVRRLEEAWGTVPSGKPERIKPVLFDAY